MAKEGDTVVAKLVARPLVEFEFGHPTKFINRRHKQRSGQNTIPPKNVQKNLIIRDRWLVPLVLHTIKQ